MHKREFLDAENLLAVTRRHAVTSISLCFYGVITVNLEPLHELHIDVV